MLTKRNWLMSDFVWIFKVKAKFVWDFFLKILDYLFLPCIGVFFHVTLILMIFIFFVTCFFLIRIHKGRIQLKQTLLKAFFILFQLKILDFKSLVYDSIRVYIWIQGIRFWDINNTSKGELFRVYCLRCRFNSMQELLMKVVFALHLTPCLKSFIWF